MLQARVEGGGHGVDVRRADAAPPAHGAERGHHVRHVRGDPQAARYAVVSVGRVGELLGGCA